MTKVFQFSVRGLLVAVTLTAIGIAALLNASAWLEALAWGAVLLMLSCALLLVVYRREEQRAFWLGFVVFGGIYLFVVLYSFTADWKNDLLTANPLHYNSLATTKVMSLAYEAAIPASRRQEFVAIAGQFQGFPWNVNTVMGVTGTTADSYAPDGGSTVQGLAALVPDGGTVTWSAGSVTTSNPSYVPLGKFISIGHTLWLLFIAAVGGKICQIIYRTRGGEESGRQPAAPS